MLARRVDAAFSGALLALFRHDAGGMRPGLERDLQHLIGRRHFQVQRNGQRLGEPRNIVIGNMAPVFAQMRGDAVGARILRQDCSAHRIGIVATTRAGENWTLTNGITCGNDVFFGPASGPMYLGGARYDSTDKHTSLAFNTTLGDNTFVPVRGPGRVYDVFEWLFSRDLVGVSDRLNYTLDIMYSILNDIDGAYYKRDGYFPRMYRGNASWYGFLNYFTYNFTDDLSGTFRFEVFDDPFGVRTGFEGVYTTYTLGAVWKMSEGLWLRPELRLDNNEQSKAYAFKNNLFTATADFILRW